MADVFYFKNTLSKNLTFSQLFLGRVPLRLGINFLFNFQLFSLSPWRMYSISRIYSNSFSVLDLLHARSVSPFELRSNRLNALAIRTIVRSQIRSAECHYDKKYSNYLTNYGIFMPTSSESQQNKSSMKIFVNQDFLFLFAVFVVSAGNSASANATILLTWIYVFVSGCTDWQ